MASKVIFLLSIYNDSGVPERGRYIVLRGTRAAGNHHCGPSCLQHRTEYRRFRFHVQADADGKPGEGLRLAKVLSQPLKELLMEFCPANLLDTLLHKMIMWCALYLFTGHVFLLLWRPFEAVPIVRLILAADVLLVKIRNGDGD